jgi:hypothetical protein
MPDRWTWDQMIEEFRTLGGVADNICHKEGPYGLGIFPLDPSQPVHVQTPSKLLFPIDDIVFMNGALSISESASGIGARQKAFLEKYERDFSWGSGGRDDCSAILDAMEQLPAGLREYLTKQFGMGHFFHGDRDERVQKRFLKSRSINSKAGSVIMPVVDLINHGVQGVAYDFKDGIAVKGVFSGEALARYNINDAFGFFSSWGFASEEPTAFAFPMRLQLGSRHLLIRRDLNKKSTMGNLSAPVVKIDGSNVHLSWLLLGNTRAPRIPKTIFYRLMRNQGIKRENAEEIFDRILHFNRMKFLKFSAELDEHEGAAITLLRKMCWYQLMALSSCIGSREL